jgi:hypothetical protein
MSPPALAPLTRWLEDPGSSRALVVEDGSTGSTSPLARWIEGVRAAGAYEVIAVSVDPREGRVLERDVLLALHAALYPEEQDALADDALAEIREALRVCLAAADAQRRRIVALDRVSWGERSLGDDLGRVLGRLGPDQKVVVSLRWDGGPEPDLGAWRARLGWTEEQTRCLRLPALPDGDPPPMERARRWAETCLHAEEASDGVADVLDVLAAAQRPTHPDELAIILDRPRSAVEEALLRAPRGAVVEDGAGRRAFGDPTAARAWAALRDEACARVRARLLALGEAALRGDAQGCPPYVIEHYGAILGEDGGYLAQIPLVSEAWANAWSPLGDPLGFEADVSRAWFAAERALLARAPASRQESAAPIVAIFRCVQVSKSVTARARSESGSIARERAAALAGLAEGLGEPWWTRAREHAVDALLAVGADLAVSDADLLARLASGLAGERREAVARRVLAAARADVADGGNGVWLLRVAPLLPAPTRSALCEEALSEVRELPEDDAWALRDALDAAPDLTPILAQATPSLPPPDRFRFACALAPHLQGDDRRRLVAEILDAVEAHTFRVGLGDVRSLAPALDVAQLSRVARALQRVAYSEESVGVCLRALCALGHASEAASLAGPDVEAMPFDWTLALATCSREARSSLREELERRLSTMDQTRLGWTIERDAAELVDALGVAPLVRLARAISAGEERIVARVALVPFAVEAEKRALVREAVEAFRAPTGQEGLHWRELLSCWEWMPIPDACHLLIHGSHDVDALWALKELGPLLKHLAGADGPAMIAEQLIEVGQWAP